MAQRSAMITTRAAVEREAERYEKTLVEAQEMAAACEGTTTERLVEVHRYLEKFEAEPRRDTAITALEPCRKKAARQEEKIYRDIRVRLRREHAIAIEEAFDENNPYSRGRFLATVKGDTLQIRMSGNFEGRARHSQEQVDAWCDETGLFDSISLRNAHGTFTCRSEVPSRVMIENLLEKDGLLGLWSPPISGDQPTPKMPPPLPPPSLTENESLKGRLATATAQVEGPQAELEQSTAEADKARSTVRRIDGDQDLREQEWRSTMQDSAKTITGAGVGVTIAGALGVSLGIYFAYLRSETQNSVDALKPLGMTDSDLTDKLSQQKNITIAGLVLGIPLLITGVILVVAGKRRKDASQARVTMAPGGAALRF